MSKKTKQRKGSGKPLLRKSRASSKPDTAIETAGTDCEADPSEDSIPSCNGFEGIIEGPWFGGFSVHKPGSSLPDSTGFFDYMTNDDWTEAASMIRKGYVLGFDASEDEVAQVALEVGNLIKVPVCADWCEDGMRIFVWERPERGKS